MARSLEELKKQYESSGHSMSRGPMMHGGRGPRNRGMKGGKPKNSGKTIKRILGYLSPYKFRFIAVFLCMAVSTVTSLVGSYMLSPIINRIAGYANEGNADFADRFILNLTSKMKPLFELYSGNENFSEIVSYLIVGIICLGTIYITSALTTFIQSKLMLHISQGAIQTIRNDLFRSIQKLPVRFHDSHPTGELMSRFTNDVDNIVMMLDTTVVSLVSGIATLIGTLVFMIKLNIVLTVITVIFIPVFAFGGMAIARLSGKYYSSQQAALGAVNGYIEESISGQKVIKVFNHEDEAVEEFNLLNENLREKQRLAQFYGGLMGPIMGNISKISYAITAGIGGVFCFLTLTGAISPDNILALSVGGLTVFVNYANHFARPINEISHQMTTVFSALAGAERVFSVMDEKPEVNEGTKILENVKGEVVFDNVTFGYNENKTVLKNLSLYAKPGQKVAFVGSTGAGKTTITNLINRFYDINEGTITIDGVDVKEYSKDSLRSSIAMVLQDTHLFTGTVKENIRYGRPDATDEEVIAAAKTASAHSFIMRLSDGYDTVLTGDGANLSQGQRQLLNIARAAISKAPILILDEATSSVDTRTERHIEHGMDRLMKNRTTFVIAHRLSTVKNSNVIMVLEQGEIIERGRHEDLLELKGRYYDLYTGKKELD